MSHCGCVVMQFALHLPCNDSVTLTKMKADFMFTVMDYIIYKLQQSVNRFSSYCTEIHGNQRLLVIE